jgi:hypothetical protein
VSLANLASLSEERGSAQVDYNRQPRLAVIANLDGIPLGATARRL